MQQVDVDITQSCGVIIVDFMMVEGYEPRILCLRAYSRPNPCVKPSCWGFPKGRMEPGEEKIDTAIRETAEETGLIVGQDYALTGQIAPSIMYGKGKRKKVATFFIAERASERDPTLPVNPELGHPEHDQWLWVPISEMAAMMPDRLVPVVEYLVTMTRDGGDTVSGDSDRSRAEEHARLEIADINESVRRSRLPVISESIASGVMSAWRLVKPAIQAIGAGATAYLTARQAGRAWNRARQGDVSGAARQAAAGVVYGSTGLGAGRHVVGTALARDGGSDKDVERNVGNAMSVEEAMDAIMLDRLPHHERITQMNLIAQNVPELGALDDALDIYQSADGYGTNSERIRSTLSRNAGNISLLSQLFRYVYKTLRETRNPKSLSEVLVAEGMNAESEMVARGMFDESLIPPPAPVGYRPDLSQQSVQRAGRAAARDWQRQQSRARQLVTESEVRRLVREMIVGNIREM